MNDYKTRTSCAVRLSRVECGCGRKRKCACFHTSEGPKALRVSWSRCVVLPDDESGGRRYRCGCGGHSGAAGSICGVFVVQDDDMTIAANRVGWELGAGKGVRSALSPAGRNTRGLV